MNKIPQELENLMQADFKVYRVVHLNRNLQGTLGGWLEGDQESVLFLKANKMSLKHQRLVY